MREDVFMHGSVGKKKIRRKEMIKKIKIKIK